MKQYKETLSIQPRNAAVHNNLGLMRLGRVDEAAKYFWEAIRLVPEYANVHFHLSIILKKKGLHKEAALHYIIKKQYV